MDGYYGVEVIYFEATVPIEGCITCCTASALLFVRLSVTSGLVINSRIKERQERSHLMNRFPMASVNLFHA